MNMVSDEKLMRAFVRANALARRKRKDVDENYECFPQGKGAGLILDMLVTEEGLSQQHIADEIGIRPQSVSEVLVKLENQGFIRRVAGKADKRTVLIYITEEGKNYRIRLAEARIAHAENFFSVLSEEEKQDFYSVLKKLNQAHKAT